MESVAWRASRTTRRESTRKMWLHSIDSPALPLFNESFHLVNKKLQSLRSISLNTVGIYLSIDTA